jgi:hypothetical protein
LPVIAGPYGVPVDQSDKNQVAAQSGEGEWLALLAANHQIG